MKNKYNVHSTDLEEPQVQEHSTDLYELQVPEHSTDLDELQVQEHSKDRGERNKELTEVLPDFILKPFANSNELHEHFAPKLLKKDEI